MGSEIVGNEARKNRKTRKKQPVDGMYPIKVWLSTREAAAYLDVSVGEMARLSKIHGMSVANLIPGGRNLYYKVSELNAMFSKNILVRCSK